MTAPTSLKVTRTQFEMIDLLCVALTLLKEYGQIGGFTMQEPGLFFVSTRPAKRLPPNLKNTHSVSDWHSLAYELSCMLGGVFWYGSSVTWKFGPYSIFLCDRKQAQSIMEARMISHELTGRTELPYSVPANARLLLDWVGVTDPRPYENFMRDVSWLYQKCSPGTLPSGKLFDVKSCYASILSRMPSPLLTVYKGRVIFIPLAKGQRDRWKQVVKAIQLHKGLRNSFVGSMAGVSPSGKGLYVYHFGERIPAKGLTGPLRSAALLVARTAYELCADAVEESRAVYANTDCVITEYSHCPRAWEKHGLTVRLVAEGKTDIRAMGCYQVGEKKTKPYLLGEKTYGARWMELGNRDFIQTPSLQVHVKGPQWSTWLEAA